MLFTIFVRLVIVWVVVAGGMLTVGAGILAFGMVAAVLRDEPEHQEFHTAFGEALCDVGASIEDPAGIGVARRLAALSVVDPGNTLDFRGLPERWRTVCLTSVNSGGLYLSRIAGNAPFFRMQRSLCFDWSAYTIAVVAVDEHNVAFPFQLKVRNPRDKTIRKPTMTEATEDFTACAPREEARALCISFSRSDMECDFAFPRILGERR